MALTEEQAKKAEKNVAVQGITDVISANYRLRESLKDKVNRNEYSDIYDELGRINRELGRIRNIIRVEI